MRYIWLRVVCFACCLPSGGALLAKVYGVSSLQVVALAIGVPCYLALGLLWWWAERSGKRAISSQIAAGFLGGLLGTVAYDLARVPFLLAGQRVFAPISAYGVWIVGADMSSRFTEVAGWTYHFSNGIAFGIMYALFMSRRHWLYAVVWGITLETIAVVSPFARIFSLSDNYYVLVVAYLGHVAYGVPLGWLSRKPDELRTWLANTPVLLQWMGFAMVGVAVAGPIFAPGNVERDARALAGEFRIEGDRLNPDWLRVERGREILISNPGSETATVFLGEGESATQIRGGQKASVSFSSAGIRQLYVKTTTRSRSSFVIIEPVEEQQP